MKIIKIIILIIILFISFVFYVNKAFLYSGIPTHYNLTQEMIELYNMTYDPDVTAWQSELIIRGSVDEDTLPRPAFHLYDPVYNRAPFGVYTAKEWGVEPGIQKSAIQKFASILFSIFRGEFKYHGDYSWPASVKYFAKNDLDEAYYGLGHILHLIEDMDVPAHTRNDHHLMGDPFEKWARDSATAEDYDWADKLYNQGYYPKYLYSLEQAFDELAGYSNKYFFSKDTILSRDYRWPKIVEERKEDLPFIGSRIYGYGADEHGDLFRLLIIKYPLVWKNKIFGVKDEPTYEINRDQKLNHDYWQRLAPRAIIYGAGVIRLFVREIEFEKEKLSQKEPELNWFQKAQLFIKNTLGIGDEEEEPEPMIASEPWPLPEPSHFPDAGPLQVPVERSLEEEVGGKSDTSNRTDKSDKTDEKEIKEEPAQEKPEEAQEPEKEKEEDGATIVKGPKTGGGGGGISLLGQRKLISRGLEVSKFLKNRKKSSRKNRNQSLSQSPNSNSI